MNKHLNLRRVHGRSYLLKPRLRTREELESYSQKIQPNLLASKRREWVNECLRYQEETGTPVF